MLTPLLRVLPVGRASSQMLYDPSVDPLWPEIKVRCRLQVLRRSKGVSTGLRAFMSKT